MEVMGEASQTCVNRRQEALAKVLQTWGQYLEENPEEVIKWVQWGASNLATTSQEMNLAGALYRRCQTRYYIGLRQWQSFQIRTIWKS